MSLTDMEIQTARAKIRALLPLTQARRQNVDTNLDENGDAIPGVTGQPTIADTGADGGNTPYDEQLAFDYVLKTLNDAIPAVPADTDGLTEGTTNQYFTDAKALAVCAARLGYFTVASSGTPDLNVSGNSTDITSSMVNKLVDFRGNSLTADHELSFQASVGTAGDFMFVKNESSSSAGYVLTINGDLQFGASKGLGHGDIAVLLKLATNWIIVALYNVDTGIFGLPQPAAGDDGKILEWDNDNTRFILVDKPSGGGGGSFTPSQANIYDAVKAIIVGGTDNDTQMTITLPAAGSFTWPTTALTTLADEDEFIVQDDTDDVQKVITLANLRTVINSGMSGNPENHEQVYGGHQSSNDFSSWAYADADVMHDVRTAGQTFMLQIPDVPNGDYYYFVFPNDRLPTMLVDGIGANRVSSFTTAARTIGSQSLTVYYRQNNSGIEAPVPYTITTA